MDYDGMKKPNTIFPCGENEVSHAIKCAHDNDALLCAHSRGHGYVGDSASDSMITDMLNLKRNMLQDFSN